MTYFYFIFTCIVWGASFILMKKADVVFGPVSIAAGRVIGGTFCVAFVWYIYHRRRLWPILRRNILPLLVIAVVGYVYPFIMQPHLIGKYQDSSFFGMMICLMPLMTIIVSIPILRVYPNIWQVIGVAGGLAGILVLMGEGAINRNISSVDLVLAASVPLLYSISNVIINRWLSDLSTIALTYCAGLMSIFILLPLAIHTESVEVSQNIPSALSVAIACIIVLGFVGTGIATLMYFRLVQKRGPLFAGLVTYIIPFGALMWGWLDSETITATQLYAMVGILVMVAIVQYATPAVVTESDNNSIYNP